MSLREDLGLPDPDESSLLQVWRPKMVSAAELQIRKYPETVSYIDDLIHEGLTMLGGKPKIGKSLWVLDAGVAIASGGVAFGNRERNVTQSPTLIVTLEDGEKRLQNRLGKLLPPDETWPENLRFVTEWPKFEAGGLDLLGEVIDRDGYKAVFIDPIGRLRKVSKGRDAYQGDTDAIAEIHDLVRDRPGLAVVLIHHNRKDDRPDDYIDALSGTTGITGVPDHIAVLQRGRGEADAVLRFTSRDAEEHDTAFKLEDGMWTELGDAVVYQLSKARQDLLVAIDDFGGSATVKDLAGYLEKTKPAIIQQLQGLRSEGLVYQDEVRGPWKKPPNRPNPLNDEAEPLGEESELGLLWEEE